MQITSSKLNSIFLKTITAILFYGINDLLVCIRVNLGKCHKWNYIKGILNRIKKKKNGFYQENFFFLYILPVTVETSCQKYYLKVLGYYRKNSLKICDFQNFRSFVEICIQRLILNMFQNSKPQIYSMWNLNYRLPYFSCQLYRVLNLGPKYHQSMD